MTANGNVSFWYADMGGVPGYRPPLPGRSEVDICIVGAGFTGLWAAYYLSQAEPSARIAVVEKEFAGFGASGRNGGWCWGGFGWNPQKYLSSGTREGIIAFQRHLAGTPSEVTRVAELERIDADILQTRVFMAACSPAQMARVRQNIALLRDWGVTEDRSRLLDAKEAAAIMRLEGLEGGILTEGAARVQPAKLARGLAEAVERRGVTIWENTPVTRILPGRVDTSRGPIRARIIIRATEGFTPALPGAAREIMPLRGAVIVTDPLPQEMWDRIGWQGSELLAHALHDFNYAQRTREGRILIGAAGVPYNFGSGTDKRGEVEASSIADLTRRLHALLPQTKGIGIAHGWCGVMGVSRDWTACIRFDPDTGLASAGGYVGLGVSTTNLAGRTLTDLILRRETDLTALPWVGRTAPNWEPEPLRWLGVRGMHWLYHMADKAETRSGKPGNSWMARLADAITGH